MQKGVVDMKAVRIYKFGGEPPDLIYEDVSLPRQSEDEVIVNV
jgi:NADPH:quinone reductase-like Zn-dependent oxidoreductase